MVVARSHFKRLLFCCLFLVSCTEKTSTFWECQGIDLDNSSFFVDGLRLAPLHFASGEERWLLEGEIVHRGEVSGFQMLYEENPMKVSSPFRVLEVPSLLQVQNKEIVDVVVTFDGKNVGVSWEGEHSYLRVKSYITLGR